jgi:methionine aminotransferase
MPSFIHPISSKLPEVSNSIFTVMSALANQHNAINLSQGFPNFSSDLALSALVNKALINDYNQYAPMAGIIGLREEIARKLNDQY